MSFVIRPEPGETANLQEWQHWSGTLFGGIDINANLLLGNVTAGTNGISVAVVKNGTAPASSPADAFQMYSADQAAGNAVPHFRTENGSIIKLYQVATYTPTNFTTDRSFDASATTLTELANVLGTLITDLKATGLLG
jgi:hypothetical protein